MYITQSACRKQSSSRILSCSICSSAKVPVFPTSSREAKTATRTARPLGRRKKPPLVPSTLEERGCVQSQCAVYSLPPLNRQSDSCSVLWSQFHDVHRVEIPNYCRCPLNMNSCVLTFHRMNSCTALEPFAQPILFKSICNLFVSVCLFF